MNALVAPQTDAARPPLQRSQGAGRISVRADAGRTWLERLYQDGCGKLRLPRDAEASGLEAVMINTAGGLTGGDRMHWAAETRAGAELTLTTQACERIYRARDGVAEVRVTLAADQGATVGWLPQETILYDGGALSRRLDADLAPDATLLAVEAVILGRQAMGERVARGRFHDRWRVRRGGRLVFADDLRLSGDIDGQAGRNAALACARAFASILLVAPDAEARLPEIRRGLPPGCGASAFDGKLVARITAGNGRALRRTLIPILETLKGGPLPRVWRS